MINLTFRLEKKKKKKKRFYPALRRFVLTDPDCSTKIGSSGMSLGKALVETASIVCLCIVGGRCLCSSTGQHLVSSTLFAFSLDIP